MSNLVQNKHSDAYEASRAALGQFSTVSLQYISCIKLLQNFHVLCSCNDCIPIPLQEDVGMAQAQAHAPVSGHNQVVMHTIRVSCTQSQHVQHSSVINTHDHRLKSGNITPFLQPVHLKHRSSATLQTMRAGLCPYTMRWCTTWWPWQLKLIRV